MTHILQIDAKLSTPSVSPPVYRETKTPSTQTMVLALGSTSSHGRLIAGTPSILIHKDLFLLRSAPQPHRKPSLEQFSGTAIPIFGSSPRPPGGSREAGRDIGERIEACGHKRSAPSTTLKGLFLLGWGLGGQVIA